jgi:F-type H+-transporting ATPase subunit gamma
MESAQSIKLRMGSISGTKQITKSMQLISTTKVQNALRRREWSEPYFAQAQQTVRNLLRFAGNFRHAYVQPEEVGCTVVIVISSDRGLCGAYNTNICKEAYRHARQADARYVTVGLKARDYFRRRKKHIERFFRGTSEKPFYEDAKEVAQVALDLYAGGLADKVLLVYTGYESMLVHTPKTIKLLPLERVEEKDEKLRLMNYEPGMGELLDYAVPGYVKACVYGALQEAALCEQSARLTSMDAATRSCGDIIDKLSLQYNRIRQGSITQELTEIVGGAQALKNNVEGS